MPSVGAVLFAADQARVARFYREVVGLNVEGEGEHHTTLRTGDFELVVHQAHGASPSSNGSDVERREGNPIRLDFRVGDLEAARVTAAECGGRIDDTPPSWAPADASYAVGHDPEGNVVLLIEDQTT